MALYDKHKAFDVGFARWRVDETFERLNKAGNQADRLVQGRLPTLSLALGDAQSVKSAPRLGQQRGLDSYKRLNGHKRQVLCDTGRRSWRVVVNAANGHDSRGAHPLLPARSLLRPAWAILLSIALTGNTFCTVDAGYKLVVPSG